MKFSVVGVMSRVLDEHRTCLAFEIDLTFTRKFKTTRVSGDVDLRSK